MHVVHMLRVVIVVVVTVIAIVAVVAAVVGNTTTRVAVNSFWLGLMIYGHTHTHAQAYKQVRQPQQAKTSYTAPKKKIIIKIKIASNSYSIETSHHA